ncbi:MAG: extracellular solute-binding protein [Ruminococcus sp.]|nr:extracellular solute-binding protein [Ruminococcus sp.]
MKMKKICAVTAAVLTVCSAASCGGKKDKKDDFEATNNIEVMSTDKVDAIPEGVDGTIIYLGVSDLNPTKGNPEKSTELTLFEEKGGKIEYQSTTYFERFEKLATALMAEKDVPDITNYEWLSFPAHSVDNRFQPIDPIVNFDDPLWADVKDDAEQYALFGKHYVAPLRYEASAMMCYDGKLIDDNGLNDPYELYLAGEWNWDNWYSIMSDYCKGATGDEERYGINGFFKQHITQQTGKTLVTFDPETTTFASNLDDGDIEAAQTLLYNMDKEGLILNGWIGSARDAFNQGCLFYAMGDWGYSGNNSPKEDEVWRVVPMPAYTKNPQKITTSDMKAFMWVRGSTKNEALKCWFECCRVTYNDPDYKETNKQKFMENNPYWTDEMYDVKMDVVSEDYYMLYDYSYGVSSALGDPNSFDGNNSLTDTLYISSSQDDAEGVQKTWTQVREEYSPTVDYEVNELNKKIDSMR